jgi:hypothetical protein
MPLYNYIRPLWRNGPGAVGDAPRWVTASIERALRSNTSADRRALIHLDRDPGNGLTVAWVRCWVSIREGTSYRSAQYAHAIAADESDALNLTRELALKLLESVYSRPLVDGIAAQQRFFECLDYPEDIDVARSLFVGKDHLARVLAAREPNGTLPTREIAGPASEMNFATEPVLEHQPTPASETPATEPISELGFEPERLPDQPAAVSGSPPPLSSLFTGGRSRSVDTAPRQNPCLEEPVAEAPDTVAGTLPAPPSPVPTPVPFPSTMTARPPVSPEVRLGPSRAAELAESMPTRDTRKRKPRFRLRRMAAALGLVLLGTVVGLATGILLLDDSPDPAHARIATLVTGALSRGE